MSFYDLELIEKNYYTASYWNIKNIIIDKNNNYFNASNFCKTYNSDLSKWINLDRTAVFLENYKMYDHIDSNPVITGTYLYKNVLLDLFFWINSENYLCFIKLFNQFVTLSSETSLKEIPNLICIMTSESMEYNNCYIVQSIGIKEIKNKLFGDNYYVFLHETPEARIIVNIFYSLFEKLKIDDRYFKIHFEDLKNNLIKILNTIETLKTDSEIKFSNIKENSYLEASTNNKIQIKEQTTLIVTCKDKELAIFT